MTDTRRGRREFLNRPMTKKNTEQKCSLHVSFIQKVFIFYVNICNGHFCLKPITSFSPVCPRHEHPSRDHTALLLLLSIVARIIISARSLSLLHSLTCLSWETDPETVPCEFNYQERRYFLLFALLTKDSLFVHIL